MYAPTTGIFCLEFDKHHEKSLILQLCTKTEHNIEQSGKGREFTPKVILDY